MRLFLFFILLSVTCTAQVEVSFYNGRKVAVVDWDYFVQGNVNYKSLQFQCSADEDSLLRAIELKDMVNGLHIEEIMYLRSVQDSLEKIVLQEHENTTTREQAVHQCLQTVDAYKVDLKLEQKKTRQLRWAVRGLVAGGVVYIFYRIYGATVVNR